MDPIVNNLMGLALIGGSVLMFLPIEEPAPTPKKPYAALVDLGYRTAQETLEDTLPDPKDYPRASLTCISIGDRLKVRGQVNSFFDGCHSQLWDVYFARDRSGKWTVDQVDLNGSKVETVTRIPGSRSHALRGDAVCDAPRRLPLRVGPQNGQNGIPTQSMGTSFSGEFRPPVQTDGPLSLRQTPEVGR